MILPIPEYRLDLGPFRASPSQHAVWVAEVEKDHGAPLGIRESAPAPVVAVRDDDADDYRVKVWLQSTAPRVRFSLWTGGAVLVAELPDRGGGHYEGKVLAEDLERVGVQAPVPPPIAGIKAARFVRRPGKKFWHAEGVSADAGISLKERRGGPLIAVRNDGGQGDFRLKLWLDAQHPGGKFAINGVDVELPHVGGGRYQGPVAVSVLDALGVTETRIVKRAPRPKVSARSAAVRAAAKEKREALRKFDEQGRAAPDEPFADVCYEAHFAPGQHEHEEWEGSTEALPEWLGEPLAFRISPPKTGGGWHRITLRLESSVSKTLLERGLLLHRINRVWVRFVPVIEGQTFEGRFDGVCDPQDLALIRYFTQTDLSVAPDEPMVPRTRLALRALSRTVANHLPDIMGWEADIKALRTSTTGMAGSQGQVDVHRMLADRWWGVVAAKQASLKRIIARGGDPSAKQAEINAAKEAAQDYEEDVNRLAAQVQDNREKALAARKRLTERERPYAAEIRSLFPAPPLPGS